MVVFRLEWQPWRTNPQLKPSLFYTHTPTCTNHYSLQSNHDHCIHNVKGQWDAHVADWASMQTDVFTDIRLCISLSYSAATMVDLWHGCQCMRLQWAVTPDCDSFVTVVVMSVGFQLVVSSVCKIVSYTTFDTSVSLTYISVTENVHLTDWYFQLWGCTEPQHF